MAYLDGCDVSRGDRDSSVINGGVVMLHCCKSCKSPCSVLTVPRLPVLTFGGY